MIQYKEATFQDSVAVSHQEQAKQRDYSLDVIRVLACMMVVLMHSPYPSEYAIGPLYSTIYYLTTPCIGLFFMTSGALLLPAKQPIFPFLKHRIGHIIWPTLIWTIFYLILNNVLKTFEHPLLVQLLSIPFSPEANGVLWFMYCLTGIYIVTPIISPWIRQSSNREIAFVLGLWTLTLLFPLLRSSLVIVEGNTGMFYYFSGYIGYFILGYYVKKRGLYLPKGLMLIIYLICAISPLIAKYLGWKDEMDEDIFWYLGPFVALMTLCIYKWIGVNCKQGIQEFFEKHNIVRKVICDISKLSFGIYLVHIAVMRYFLWNQDWFADMNNCVNQILISFSFSFIVSWLIIYLISKIPGSKYIIGT